MSTLPPVIGKVTLTMPPEASAVAGVTGATITLFCCKTIAVPGSRVTVVPTPVSDLMLAEGVALALADVLPESVAVPPHAANKNTALPAIASDAASVAMVILVECFIAYCSYCEECNAVRELRRATSGRRRV